MSPLSLLYLYARLLQVAIVKVQRSISSGIWFAPSRLLTLRPNYGILLHTVQVFHARVARRSSLHTLI